MPSLPARDIGGKLRDVSDQVVDMSGQVIDTSGQVVDTSGQAVDSSGQKVDSSGQKVDSSGQAVDTSGQVIDASGQAVDTSGQVIDASGQAVDTSGVSISVSSAVWTGAGFQITVSATAAPAILSISPSTQQGAGSPVEFTLVNAGTTVITMPTSVWAPYITVRYNGTPTQIEVETVQKYNGNEQISVSSTNGSRSTDKLVVVVDRPAYHVAMYRIYTPEDQWIGQIYASTIKATHDFSKFELYSEGNHTYPSYLKISAFETTDPAGAHVDVSATIVYEPYIPYGLSRVDYDGTDMTLQFMRDISDQGITTIGFYDASSEPIVKTTTITPNANNITAVFANPSAEMIASLQPVYDPESGSSTYSNISLGFSNSDGISYTSFNPFPTYVSVSAVPDISAGVIHISFKQPTDGQYPVRLVKADLSSSPIVITDMSGTIDIDISYNPVDFETTVRYGNAVITEFARVVSGPPPAPTVAECMIDRIFENGASKFRYTYNIAFDGMYVSWNDRITANIYDLSSTLLLSVDILGQAAVPNTTRYTGMAQTSLSNRYGESPKVIFYYPPPMHTVPWNISESMNAPGIVWDPVDTFIESAPYNVWNASSNVLIGTTTSTFFPVSGFDNYIGKIVPVAVDISGQSAKSAPFSYYVDPGYFMCSPPVNVRSSNTGIAWDYQVPYAVSYNLYVQFNSHWRLYKSGLTSTSVPASQLLPGQATYIVSVERSGVHETESGYSSSVSFSNDDTSAYIATMDTTTITPVSATTLVSTVQSTVFDISSQKLIIKKAVAALENPVLTVPAYSTIDLLQLAPVLPTRITASSFTRASTTIIVPGTTIPNIDSSIIAPESVLYFMTTAGSSFQIKVDGVIKSVSIDINNNFVYEGHLYPLGSGFTLGTKYVTYAASGSQAFVVGSPPQPPTLNSVSISLSPVSRSSANVSVSAGTIEDNGAVITKYDVWLYPTTGSTLHATSTSLPIRITGLTPGASYTWRMAATNSVGESAAYPAENLQSITFTTTAICFLGNAPVLTPTGYRRIDSLREGDVVQTADGRTVAIQRVAYQRLTASATVNPYVIERGQFGATRRVLISPEHRVAVAGRGLVEARHLGLHQQERTGILEYYNLELPDWERDNLVVGGVEVESLAPVRRVVITHAMFRQMLAQQYGDAMTPAIQAMVLRNCKFLPGGRVEVSTMRRNR